MSEWPYETGEMADRIRDYNWAATQLGAAENWPQSLRVAVDMMLAMPGPATILWGPHHVQIYNDAYLAIARERHPALLGQPVRNGWPDAYEAVIAPLLGTTRAGRATRLTDFPVLLKEPNSPPEERLFDTDWSPIRDESGAVAGVLQTLVETTDRLKMQTAMRESEARHRLLIGSWAQAVWETDADGSIIADSPSWRAYTGQTLEEWLGYGWLNAIHPDDRAYAERQWREAIAARELVDAEFRISAPGGGWRWTNVRAAPVHDAGGVVEKWAGINIDIDARKRAETALRESEELRRIAVAGGGMGTWRWDLSDTLIWGDAAFLSLWGFPPSDEPRHLSDFTDRMSPQGQAEMGDMITRAIASDEEFDGQLAVVNGPTSGTWVRWRGRAERDRSWIVNGVSFDVTAQRLADERLHASEERYRAFVTASSDAVYRMSPDWLQMRQLDGRGFLIDTGDPDENWIETYILSEDRPHVLQAIEASIRDKRTFELEHRVRRADGSVGWTLSRAVPIFAKDGAISEWLGAARDVAERKTAETALRESEERQAFLLVLGDQMRGQADADATIATASRLLGEHLRASRIVFAGIDDDAGLAHIREGWTADGALTHPAELRLTDFGGPLLDDLRAGRIVRYDHVGEPPFARSDLAALHAIGIQAGLSVPLIVGGRFVMNLNVHQHQARRWSDAEVGLVKEAAERIWAAVERAQAEEALRESEGRLAAAFESMPVGIAAIDAEGRTIVANSQYRHYMPSGLIPSRDLQWGDRWRAWDEQGAAIVPQNFPGARALRGESVIPGQVMLYTDDQGREIWTNVATAPTLDPRGRVTGAVTVVSDIDERKRTGEALRQSEERFQQFSQASPDILWSRDAETLQWDYLSPAFEHVFGIGRGEALKGNNLRRWLELVLPDDRHDTIAAMRRVREGELVTFEYRIRRPSDGQVRWIRNTDFPIRDQTGRVHRIGGVGQDITELKASEAALTHSEQRLRTLVEGMSQLVWRAIDNGDWTWASPQWVAFTGQAELDSHHLGWLDAVHPDDHEAAMAVWAHALQTGGFAVEFRIRNASDGEYRWFQTRATPVRDAAGVVMEWLGTSTDIHELRSLQDRQKVLVAELQHRTRNLMGVVRATSESILRESTDLADFGVRYRDRLDALTRVQGLLSRLEGVERITFDDLIESELKAIGAIDGGLGKVVLNGPAGIALRSSTVQTFALALHELATNAVKYGALASTSGHLAVTWRLEHHLPEGVPWLHVDWHESGVAMPSADALPQGTGQGRRLIERALPYQLGARTTYVMGPDGVRCSIAVPISSRTVTKDEDERSIAPS